jgi:hypothetical protein
MLMFQSLRKAHASVYLQHEITGHNIGAELFESEFLEGVATLRLRLRPVDENQKNDEQYLASSPLISATFNDLQVVTSFVKRTQAQRSQVRSWRLLMVSSVGKTFSFAVIPSLEDHGAAQSLVLTVAS